MKIFKVLLTISADDDTTEEEVREEILTLDEKEYDFSKTGLLTVEDLRIEEKQHKTMRSDNVSAIRRLPVKLGREAKRAFQKRRKG